MITKIDVAVKYYFFPGERKDLPLQVFRQYDKVMGRPETLFKFLPANDPCLIRKPGEPETLLEMEGVCVVAITAKDVDVFIGMFLPAAGILMIVAEIKNFWAHRSHREGIVQFREAGFERLPSKALASLSCI